jgi:uncharacterized coiled-coil protein SlyX
VSRSDSERLTEVEVQLSHLQRHVEQLDDVITELGRLIDRQARTIVALENQIKELRDKPREAAIDLLEEKPPHY